MNGHVENSESLSRILAMLGELPSSGSAIYKHKHEGRLLVFP